MALVVVLAGVLAGRPRPRRWLAGLWHHWRHHLPSGELARAMAIYLLSGTAGMASCLPGGSA